MVKKIPPAYSYLNVLESQQAIQPQLVAESAVEEVVGKKKGGKKAKVSPILKKVETVVKNEVVIAEKVSNQSSEPSRKDEKTERTESHVDGLDQGKRLFLRLAGIAGLGVVAASVLPKKAEAYVMGSSPTSAVVGLKDSTNARIDPATNTTLTGVKTQTDKLSFDGSNNLYVQAASNFSSQLENASSVVINPATNENLAQVVTNTNPLANLTFSSGALVTTGSGGASGPVGIKDTTGTQIDPASNDAVTLLRRVVKQVDSLAVVDSQQRQRIAVDAALPTGANTIGAVNIAASQTLGTVTTVGTVSAVTAVTTVNQLAGVDARYLLIDIARNSYASGVRGNLNWS